MRYLTAALHIKNRKYHKNGGIAQQYIDTFQCNAAFYHLFMIFAVIDV